MQKSKRGKMQSLLLTLILMVTTLWVGLAVAAEKENGDGPRHRKNGDRAAVWRDLDLCPARI